MLISEAFQIAFNKTTESTENLRIAQLTLEYHQPANQPELALIRDLALRNISAELIDRNNRVRAEKRLAKNLSRRMQT